jgi:hypothetical protein
MLLALVGSAGATRADNPVLTGNVGAGDGFSISVVDATGTPVKHLDAGTYTLLVHDHSSFHNFHFTGPGVDVSTDIESIGDQSFTVTLTDGTYFFQCDPHVGQMHGSFTVGSVTTTAPTAPAPAPAAAKLALSLGSGTKIAVSPAGGLAAGQFSVSVTDRSATDGIRLKGPGVVKATGAAFVGKVTWKVALRAGRYTLSSVRHPKVIRTFTVGA